MAGVTLYARHGLNASLMDPLPPPRETITDYTVDPPRSETVTVDQGWAEDVLNARLALMAVGEAEACYDAQTVYGVVEGRRPDAVDALMAQVNDREALDLEADPPERDPSTGRIHKVYVRLRHPPHPDLARVGLRRILGRDLRRLTSGSTAWRNACELMAIRMGISVDTVYDGIRVGDMEAIVWAIHVMRDTVALGPQDGGVALSLAGSP